VLGTVDMLCSKPRQCWRTRYSKDILLYRYYCI